LCYFIFSEIKIIQKKVELEMREQKRERYNMITFTISKFLSSFGGSTYAFGMSLYVLSLTGSAMSFAVNFLCNILPSLFLSPIAGYVADTYSKKRIAIIAQIMSTVIVSSLFGSLLFFELTLPMIYVTTALLAAVGTFNIIAFNSALPTMVAKTNFQRAMSLKESSESIGSILGPIIGGILFASFSMKVFLLIFIACYTSKIVLESTIHFSLFSSSKETKKKEKGRMQDEIMDGLRYVKGHQLMMLVFKAGIIGSFIMTGMQVGRPHIVVNIMNLSSYEYGFVQAAFFVGMVMTTVILSIRKEFQYPFLIAKRAYLMLALLFTCLVIPIFVSLPSTFVFVYYVICSVIFGASIVLLNTPVAVMVIKTIPEEYLGRVTGLNDFVSSLMPLGIVMYGALFDLFDARIIMVVTSMVAFVVFAYLLRKSVLMQVHPERYEKRKAGAMKELYLSETK
jgi:MFS transporter, DHA3 family, macrolide efflux protein